MKNTEMKIKNQFIERLKTSDNRKTNSDAGEILWKKFGFFQFFSQSVHSYF